MKKVILLLFLIGSVRVSYGQDDSVDKEQEQQQLALCFKYSNELGYDVESVTNPVLYDYIMEWLGTPYRYSGGTKNGIDCSGLVCELYRSAYQTVLNGTAKDLYSKVDPIKKDQLKEGDLVFFKIRRGRISHVGIYLGSNKFAHASTQRGVIISDLNEDYYKKYYFKGGRLKDIHNY